MFMSRDQLRSLAALSVCALSVPCVCLLVCSAMNNSVNTDGNSTCGPCPSGYTGTGFTNCTDINECAINHGGCLELAVCVNTPPGRFTCLPYIQPRSLQLMMVDDGAGGQQQAMNEGGGDGGGPFLLPDVFGGQLLQFRVLSQSVDLNTGIYVTYGTELAPQRFTCSSQQLEILTASTTLIDGLNTQNFTFSCRLQSGAGRSLRLFIWALADRQTLLCSSSAAALLQLHTLLRAHQSVVIRPATDHTDPRL